MLNVLNGRTHFLVTITELLRFPKRTVLGIIVQSLKSVKTILTCLNGQKMLTITYGPKPITEKLRL